MKEIKGFFKEYSFLSNFWPSSILYEGMTYPTVEHAFQAAKTNNPILKAEIKQCKTPQEAKKKGKINFLREDWEQIKLQVMEDCLRLKFQIPELREKLLQTGDAYLEETNWWKDKFWGVCNSFGENNLGKLLMKIRSEIKDRNKF